MRWGNKSYTNWVDVYLHFMLVVEVIKLNRSGHDTWLRRPTDLWIGTNILKVEHWSEYDNLKHWTAFNVIPFQGWEVKPWTFSYTIRLFNFWRVKCFNWDAGPQKQFYCDTCPACACTRPPSVNRGVLNIV